MPGSREPHPQSSPPEPAPAVGCGALYLGRDRETTRTWRWPSPVPALHAPGLGSNGTGVVAAATDGTYMKGHTPELDVSQSVEAVGGEAAPRRLGTEAE